MEFKTYRDFDINVRIINYERGHKSMSRFSPDDPEEIEIEATAILTRGGKVVAEIELPSDLARALDLESEAIGYIKESKIQRQYDAAQDIDDYIGLSNKLLSRVLFE